MLHNHEPQHVCFDGRWLDHQCSHHVPTTRIKCAVGCGSNDKNDPIDVVELTVSYGKHQSDNVICFQLHTNYSLHSAITTFPHDDHQQNPHPFALLASSARQTADKESLP